MLTYNQLQHIKRITGASAEVVETSKDTTTYKLENQRSIWIETLNTRKKKDFNFFLYLDTHDCGEAYMQVSELLDNLKKATK